MSRIRAYEHVYCNTDTERAKLARVKATVSIPSLPYAPPPRGICTRKCICAHCCTGSLQLQKYFIAASSLGLSSLWLWPVNVTVFAYALPPGLWNEKLPRWSIQRKPEVCLGSRISWKLDQQRYVSIKTCIVLRFRSSWIPFSSIRVNERK